MSEDQNPDVINVVVLDFGYVESTGLASLVCTNERYVFDTEDEAIKSLAQDLLAKYKERFMKKPSSKSCCAKARIAKDNQYCPKCGRELHAEFDSLAFQDWLTQIVSYDLDSFGYDDYCDGRDMSWEIGTSAASLLGRPAKQVACVEQAEKTLLEVLELDADG